MSTEIKPLEPGVYFNLDEEAYHSDPALGSSNMRKVAKNPADYWFDSWMNPLRKPDKSTPAQIRGTAVHVLALYGEAQFDKRYMRGAVHEDDMTPAEKAAETKAANKRAAERGLIALPAKDYDNIAIASAMIAKNPELANALIGGLNEVSVFWVCARSGLKKKARLDVCKPRGVGDLKSLANKYDKEFERACIDAICNYRYDVQAKHYLEARALLAQFVADGRVVGQHDADLLKAVVASKEWAWQFVFWQSEGAPITYSYILSPKNPMLEVAHQTILKAEHNFNAYMEKFGPNEMWLPQEKPRELYLEDMPPWFGR